MYMYVATVGVLMMDCSPVLPHLRPVLGVSNVSVNSWRLDPKKHCCALKGLLPYREVRRRGGGGGGGVAAKDRHVYLPMPFMNRVDIHCIQG